MRSTILRKQESYIRLTAQNGDHLRFQKQKRISFITDFRKLNKQIKWKPYPIPNIQDLLQKLEGFTCAKSLDQNMGCYHIKLTPTSSSLCTIVLPWGKYEYLKLPIGLCNCPHIFQEKMGDLFADLELVRAYTDNLLILTKGDWKRHLTQIEI